MGKMMFAIYVLLHSYFLKSVSTSVQTVDELYMSSVQYDMRSVCKATSSKGVNACTFHFFFFRRGRVAC